MTDGVKKKILLIYPEITTANYSCWISQVEFLTKKPGGLLSPTLATIAALTPPEFEVNILNENLESINFDKSYDLVGITGCLNQFSRARDIAGEFSKRGVTVVCGGPSVSLNPERWKSFADVLIIGEAERTWPQFLGDYLAGSYKREYRETERLDLSISPVPDYSSYSKKNLGKFIGGIVQTSRGCPFNCEFCEIIPYMGRKTRYKPVENILQEVQQIYKMGQTRSIMLANDNLSTDQTKAKKILSALRDWNRKNRKPVSFVSTVSIDTARDEEFLELAAEAGLTRIFVGIETANIESLEETDKLQNIRSDILEDVRAFYRHGILPMSGCMVGFDHDDLSIFQQQFDFFMKSGITLITAVPVHAMDGTRLKARMVKEGRYIDWEETIKATSGGISELDTLTIIPRQMTIEQLKQGLRWLLWQLYKPENFLERFRTFLDNFESSPKKDKLDIPGTYTDLEGIRMLARLFKYLLTSGTSTERRTFWKMYGYARRSSHPQRFGLLIEIFLGLMNAHRIFSNVWPGINQVSYPT